MQGEKGSLLELQRYHRDTWSPTKHAHAGEESEDEEEVVQEAGESNLKALRALQGRLFIPGPPIVPRTINPRRSAAARRHTLANLR